MSVGRLNFSEQSRIVFLVFGPPGAGKGTQCKRLSHALQVPHISTGDLLREHVSRDTTVRQNAKGAMSKGSFVPDALVFDMLVKRIDKADCSEGFILDGFPRTLEQAELLDRHFSLRRASHEPPSLTLIMVRLIVSHASLLRRLGGRRICPRCAAVFNLHTEPPRLIGRCDFDGSNLVARDDDRDEAIAERVRLYERQTLGIVGHYAQHATQLEVDGDRPVELVTAEILRAIRAIADQARQPREIPSAPEPQAESL